MHRKKIIIVTEYFYPEEFKINEIALEWQKKGYEIDVVTSCPTYPAGKIFDGYENKWYQKDNYKGINIYRLKAVTGYKESLFKKLLKYFVFMFLGSIVTLRIGKKYDYVFGFDVGALTGMLPAVLLQKFYAKPVTLWIQDVWPDSVYAYRFKKRKLLVYFLDGFVKFIYRNSLSLTVSGKGFIKRVQAYVEDDKTIEYFPNWADKLDENLEPFKFSFNKKVQFTFAGNIGTVQNLDNIIKAFSNLKSDDLQRAQLNIIGDGSYLEKLKELTRKLKCQNIVFWGRKPRSEMSRYFKASDFLIVSLVNKPIFSLTVPAKTQTYIAAKKPILAIVNGDAAKIVTENTLGYSANPDNIEEIKDIFIKAIYTPSAKLELFTSNCESLTENVFNKEKIIDALLNVVVGTQK